VLVLWIGLGFGLMLGFTELKFKGFTELKFKTFAIFSSLH